MSDERTVIVNVEVRHGTDVGRRGGVAFSAFVFDGDASSDRALEHIRDVITGLLRVSEESK